MSSWRNYLAVAGAGVVGAGLRWLVTAPIKSHFPYDTLAVNALGCAVLGIVVSYVTSGGRRKSIFEPLAVGFCGGLTTMSTLAVEVVSLPRAEGAAYLGATLASGFACYLGARFATHRAMS